MKNKPTKSPPNKQTDDFTHQLKQKVLRKMHAQHNKSADIWFGLGMMGLVGWSIVVPTLLGAALGLWLDTHYPGQQSWTLALLAAGLLIGCFNAWRWVVREDQAMHQSQRESQDPNKQDE